MKNIVTKLMIMAFVVVGIVYFSSQRSSNELTDLLLENLKVINTASAEEGGSEKGPSSTIDCAGWGTGSRSHCQGFNSYNCISTGCM